MTWIECKIVQMCNVVAHLTPLPDQIQLKVFVTDRVKLPTYFIPKKDRLWLKIKEIQRAFFEKSFFLCFCHQFSPGPTGIKEATDQMLP